jgi:hypothetical protein
VGCDTASGNAARRTLATVQAWTSTRDVAVRGPFAPGPAVAERRPTTDDVLPAPQVAHRHGAIAWTAALVASVARTGWLAAVTTLAFLAGAFGATLVDGRSPSAAVPWVLIGGGAWLLIAVAWALLKRR